MRKLLLILLVIMASAHARAQMLAVSTELTNDLLQTPSLRFELVTGERSSLGIHAYANHNPWGKQMRMVGVQPEYRYYFSGRPMHSFFVGAGALWTDYDIHWKGKVYEGQAMGLGMTFGYVFTLTRRINIDCHAGFGMIGYKHKEYFENDFYDEDYLINGLPRTNADGYTLLPTRIGVSISYIIK